MMYGKHRSGSHSSAKFHDSSQLDSGLGVSLKHGFSAESHKIKIGSESLSKAPRAKDYRQLLSRRKTLLPYSLEQYAAAFESCPDEVDFRSERLKYSSSGTWQLRSLEQSAAAFESCPDEVSLRPKRQRYPPLDHWRNQRLIYRFQKGQILCLGVDDGTPEDKGAINSLNRSFEYRLRYRPNESTVYALFDHGRKVNIQLAKPFFAVPWPEQYAMKPYRVKIVFKTEFFYFGYLEIDGSAAMKSQCLSEYDLHMTVVRGRVEVNMKCNTIEAWYKDTFFVTGGNKYWIRNLEKRKALLSFTFGKLKFLKSNTE